MVMFASSKLPSIKARRTGWTKQVSLFKKRFGLKFAFNKLQVQNTKNLNPRQKKKRSKKKSYTTFRLSKRIKRYLGRGEKGKTFLPLAGRTRYPLR